MYIINILQFPAFNHTDSARGRVIKNSAHSMMRNDVKAWIPVDWAENYELILLLRFIASDSSNWLDFFSVAKKTLRCFDTVHTWENKGSSYTLVRCLLDLNLDVRISNGKMCIYNANGMINANNRKRVSWNNRQIPHDFKRLESDIYVNLFTDESILPIMHGRTIHQQTGIQAHARYGKRYGRLANRKHTE